MVFALRKHSNPSNLFDYLDWCKILENIIIPSKSLQAESLDINADYNLLGNALLDMAFEDF